MPHPAVPKNGPDRLKPGKAASLNLETAAQEETPGNIRRSGRQKTQGREGDQKMVQKNVWQKLAEHYPLWWEWVALILIIFSIWYPAAHYAELPAQVPTHFGASGLPDAWSPKSPVNVYLGPAVLAGTYILMTALNFWFALAPDPRRLINLPQKRLEKMTPEQLESIRGETIKGLFVLKFLLTAMSADLSYESTRVALGLQNGLNPVWLWSFFGAIMTYSLYFTVRLLKLSK